MGTKAVRNKISLLTGIKDKKVMTTSEACNDGGCCTPSLNQEELGTLEVEFKSESDTDGTKEGMCHDTIKTVAKNDDSELHSNSKWKKIIRRVSSTSSEEKNEKPRKLNLFQWSFAGKDGIENNKNKGDSQNRNDAAEVQPSAKDSNDEVDYLSKVAARYGCDTCNAHQETAKCNLNMNEKDFNKKCISEEKADLIQRFSSELLNKKKNNF